MLRMSDAVTVTSPSCGESGLGWSWPEVQNTNDVSQTISHRNLRVLGVVFKRLPASLTLAVGEAHGRYSHDPVRCDICPEALHDLHGRQVHDEHIPKMTSNRHKMASANGLR